jgi:hypothetical protein
MNRALLQELEENGVNVEGTTVWCEADRLADEVTVEGSK